MDNYEWTDGEDTYRINGDGLWRYAISPEWQGWVVYCHTGAVARELLRLAGLVRAREHEMEIVRDGNAALVKQERALVARLEELESQIRMGKLVPETREELTRLAGAIGLTVTPYATAAEVAAAATARVKELEDIEHWALSEALKIRETKIKQLRSQRDEEKRRAEAAESRARDQELGLEKAEEAAKRRLDELQGELDLTRDRHLTEVNWLYRQLLAYKHMEGAVRLATAQEAKAVAELRVIRDEYQRLSVHASAERDRRHRTEAEVKRLRNRINKLEEEVPLLG